ncbi:glycosyltransferase family 39 protein [Micromonospora sp. RTGN7]|uniref:glycosyltransferase family 39 protein n=1 Tax=Micromonospora sp. RTGN7 TaxID=3016526 RepID=UPI0029FF51AB|nr:glycosyltransferase family 39 protein [Micromonospora sp. RTGN7]
MRHLPGWLGAVWVWPTLATLAVTGVGVGGAQPWRDELATWSAATRPLGALARMGNVIDAATWPYYLFMHGWVAAFGDSPTALRLPSVLAMATTAGLTAALGERLLGRPAGLLGGLLFAVLPGTSRYAQEARPYAFVALFAVLATLLLVRVLNRPGWGRRAGYAAAVVALGLAHLVALTLLAAHALAALTSQPTPPGDPRRSRGAGRPRPPLWGWLAAVLPALVVLAPLVLLAVGQRGRQLDWVDPARPADLAALPNALTQSSTVGGLLLGLAALGAARSGRRALFPVACGTLPVLLVFLAGLAGPLWVPRYLFFTVPFACILAGAALAGTNSAAQVPKVRAGAGDGGVALPAALAVVLLAGLLGLPDQAALRHSHEWPRGALIDYRGAARVVDEGRRGGDAIVFSPRDGWLFLDLGLRYHLGDRQPRDVLVVRDRDTRGDYWADECSRPAECLAGVRRVWLVIAGRPADPLDAVPGATGDALRDGFTVERVLPRRGLTVALLTR